MNYNLLKGIRGIVEYKNGNNTDNSKLINSHKHRRVLADVLKSFLFNKDNHNVREEFLKIFDDKICTSVEILPRVILCKIFSFLDIKTMIGKVYMCCRNWQDLFYDKQSWDQLIISDENLEIFQHTSRLVDFTLVKSIKCSNDKFLHLNWRNLLRLHISTNKPRLDFKFDENISNIIGIEYLYIGSNCQVEYIPAFPNLKVIVLDDCKVDEVIFSPSIYAINLMSSKIKITPKCAKSFIDCQKILTFLNVSWSTLSLIRRMSNSEFDFQNIRSLIIEGYSNNFRFNIMTDFFDKISTVSLKKLEIDNSTLSNFEFLTRYKNLSDLRINIGEEYKFKSLLLPSLDVESLFICRFINEIIFNLDIIFGLNYPNMIKFHYHFNSLINFSAPLLKEVSLKDWSLDFTQFDKYKALKSLIVDSSCDIKKLEVYLLDHSLNSLSLFGGEFTNNHSFLKNVRELTSITLWYTTLNINNIPEWMFEIPNLKILKVDKIVGTNRKTLTIKHLFIEEI